MVSLYVFTPPSSGIKIQTLKAIANSYNLDPEYFKDRNTMLMKDNAVVLYFDNYKTSQFTGRDELALWF